MWEGVIALVLENIVGPSIVILGASAIGILKISMDKIINSMLSKDEILIAEHKGIVANNALSELSVIVDAAVATNTQLANDMKKESGKLTPEQIADLNRSVKNMINNALPADLLEEGTVLDVLGGSDRLHLIIDGLIEKYVIEEKCKLG